MPYSIYWASLPDEPPIEEVVAENVRYEDASVRLPLDGDLPAEFRSPAATRDDREAVLRWILEIDSAEPLERRQHRRYFPDTQTLSQLRKFAAILREAGSTSVEIAYDGGGDEGFAHFVGASDGDHMTGADAVCTALANGPLGEEDGGPPPLYGSFDPEERWLGMPSKERVAERLEYFATVLSWVLFGQKWGRGEYATEGQFRVDLTTGRIDDAEMNPPPSFFDRAERRWKWVQETLEEN